MEADTKLAPGDAQPSAGTPKMARPMNAAEAGYMQGGTTPVTSSVLISSSQKLNSPYFRDAFAQMSLRRFGSDLADTYDIPWMVRGIRDVTDFAELTRLVAEEKAKNADFAAWLDARRLTEYRPGTLDRYAQGTLGAAIRYFVEDSGMTMEFVGVGETIETDVDYLMKRRGVSHDIDHLVTGFWTNTLGELALALCNSTAIANYFSSDLAGHIALPTSFTGSAYFARQLFNYPAAMPQTFDAAELGIRMGKALAKPLFMYDWEDYLDWPLAELREHLGLEELPERLWDDVNDLCHG